MNTTFKNDSCLPDHTYLKDIASESEKQEVHICEDNEEADVWVPSYSYQFSGEKKDELEHNSTDHESFADEDLLPSHENIPSDYSGGMYMSSKEQIIALFQRLKLFLQDEDFGEDLRNELNVYLPNYKNVLEKRRNDLERGDHGIVVAGEISAGKSTLMNKILGKKIFKVSNLESTSTICKLRNSMKVEIVAEGMDGQRKFKDLTEKCDLETTKGVKTLRETLKDFTDLMATSESKQQYRSVDIGFPIPFLKNNTILVDTPGIGGSNKVTERLMEYLPNAVSFVFLINVANAGGMQTDRLPEILKKLHILQIDSEMPCFNPDDVLFVTTKWDTIPDDDNDSSEDDLSMTWRSLKQDLNNHWSRVKEENIFRLNLLEVSQKASNDSTKEFARFQKTLQDNIEKAANIRVVKHLRQLQDLLEIILRGLRARLELNSRTEDDQKNLAKQHKEKMGILNEKCIQVRESLRKRAQTVIEETAKNCYDYMTTPVGKERILNPGDKIPIMELRRESEEFADEVKNRINEYVQTFLLSKDVLEKISAVENELESFVEDVCLELTDMEKDWSDDKHRPSLYLGAEEPNYSVNNIPIGLSVVFPVDQIPPVYSVMTQCRNEEKRQIISCEYNKSLSTIESKVYHHLDSTYRLLVLKVIDKFTKEMLPRRIGSLQEMIKQLLELRQDILAKQGLLHKLAEQIISMEKDAAKIKANS